MNATREYGLTGVLDGLLSLTEDEKSVPGYRVSNIERGTSSLEGRLGSAG
jgi:hypothetical protein